MTETNWQTNLTSQGAVIQNEGVQHFGNALSELKATTTENTLCDLSHLGLLCLKGDDVIPFIQGQVTNDVTQLNGLNSHYSAYCSPKGRMLALFLAFSHQSTLYLQLSKPILAPIMKRLKMYVMRSKVDISDASHEMVRFGINGPSITDTMTNLLGKAPEQDYAMVAIAHGMTIKLPSIKGHQRYEVIIEASHAQQAWDALKANCTLVGKPCWDWLEIQTGCPEVLEKTQEQFVPQMLNLDLLNGINFKKGCYTGQEIVARTHYLGTVKRRTYLAQTNINTAIEAGDKVKDSDQKEVGQVVRIAPNLEGGFDVLAEMRIEASNGYVSVNDVELTLADLPFLTSSN